MAVLRNLGNLLSNSNGIMAGIKQFASSNSTSAIGRSLSTITESLPGSRGRKIAIGAGLGLTGMAGFYNATAQPTIKAAMDVAFDDPNADRAVLGTDLTPSILAAGTMGGPVGGIARGVNATRFYGYPNPVKSAAGSSVVGAAVGGLIRR